VTICLIFSPPEAGMFADNRLPGSEED